MRALAFVLLCAGLVGAQTVVVNGPGGGGTGGAVTSVAGRTGAVTLAYTDVSGLGSAATTASSAYDAAGVAATAQAAAIATAEAFSAVASNLTSDTVPAARLPLGSASAFGALKCGSGITCTSGVASASGGSVNSAALDSAFGSTQGDILYRGASTWTGLATGTSGNFLETLGSGANPLWAALTGGGTLTGSGTANSMSKWTSSSALGNALTTDNGVTVETATAAPTSNSSLTGTGSPNYLNQGGAMAVQGNYLYTTECPSGGSPSSGVVMTIVDQTNPASMKTVGTLTNSIGCAIGIAVKGTYAYITLFASGGGNDRIGVVDITQKNAPSLLTTITPVGTDPFALHVAGNTLWWIGQSGSHYLECADISNPAKPLLLPASFSFGGNLPGDFTIQDNYIYAVYESHMVVINIANRLLPVLVGTTSDSLCDGGIVSCMQGGDLVVAAGRYVYTMGYDWGELMIWDVSTPSAPAIAGHTTIAAGTSASPLGLEVFGKYAYFILGLNKTLYVYDVSVPGTLVQKSATVVLASVYNNEYPNLMEFHRGNMFIVDQGSNALLSLNLAGNTIPEAYIGALSTDLIDGAGPIRTTSYGQFDSGLNVGAPGIGTTGPVGGSAIYGQSFNPTVLYSAAGTALPTCAAGIKGQWEEVSDATTPTYMAAYTSGGGITAAVICSYNGTTYSWLTH